MDSTPEKEVCLVQILELVTITSDDTSIYQEAFENKEIAAKILIPLIEFEFGFKGLDSPELIQSLGNLRQLERVFQICKNHGWVTSEEIRRKGKNPYFRISKKGFYEIYQIAGPFEDEEQNEWTKLLLERSGKRGGYQKGNIKTEEKVL